MIPSHQSLEPSSGVDSPVIFGRAEFGPECRATRTPHSSRWELWKQPEPAFDCRSSQKWHRKGNSVGFEIVSTIARHAVRRNQKQKALACPLLGACIDLLDLRRWLARLKKPRASGICGEATVDPCKHARRPSSQRCYRSRPRETRRKTKYPRPDGSWSFGKFHG